MMYILEPLRRDLRKLSNPEKSKILQKFFKTGPGEYGEGDIFLGVNVPESRKVARKYKRLSLKDVKSLLSSKIHEERLVGVLLLVEKFREASTREKGNIVRYYLEHTKLINNWDLVDLSADKILGEFLLNNNRLVLQKLAKSKNVWERRISIVSTFQLIKNNILQDTLKISKILLNDDHDLIHKAVGWMLREVGKKDPKVLERFLKKNYEKMPRTSLRYAIERFPESKRKAYLKLKT